MANIQGIEISDDVVALLKREGIIGGEDDLAEALGLSDMASGSLETLQSVMDSLGLQGEFGFRAIKPDGTVRWTETAGNLVTNAGLDHALGVVLSGSTPSTSWYIGLVDSGPTFDGTDTMSSHTGWTENTNYSETNRQLWNEGGVSAQSIDNSGSKAVFSISATTDIAGAFLVDDNTKGGTTGVLFAEGSFNTTRSLQSGDTLNVTYTINAS